MKITFIQTGGTIDKDYPRPVEGYAFEIDKPAVKRILNRINPDFEYEIITLFKKDSQGITDTDRKKIQDTCVSQPSDKIIVTHGTDTMIETAKRLSDIKNKTIILTGSFKPERFTQSDAPVNLGVAIGALYTNKKGVFIAMNGRLFKWDRVKRDPQTGQFIEKNKI